ncbi:VTT domain-containing protein [Tundrisphaera lichenicola]|uniref:VTT domain-containing protein n=1 Tax=Tundrisphaera lichenicola TaxID=2029860 RepID=UPI003EBD8C02
MAFLRQIIDSIRMLTKPESLNSLALSLGPGLYVLLFAVIFAETGLVAVPFLPGDSLLFAVGAVSASPNSPISLPLVAGLLIVAAILGDAVNYWVGYKLGPKVFASEGSWLLNKKHLTEAQKFYDRHGGKTIILARFVPIVRTFAPFVAGVGRMNYGRFLAFNIVGGISWVLICLLAGWGFGGLPFVQKNFELVLIAIIAISVVPAAIEMFRGWLAARQGHSALVEATTLEPTELDEPA